MPTIVGPVAGGTGAGPLPSSSGGPAGGTGRTSGAFGAVVPSGRGAPGAFGSALGSKASDLRRPDRDRRLDCNGRRHPGRRPGDDRGRRGGLARALAEADFDVLPELLELVFQPALGVLQFLDAAVRLPQLFLEPVDPHHHRGGLVRIAVGLAGNVAGRRHLGGLRRLAVEEIEALRLGGRGGREQSGHRRGQAQVLGSNHGEASAGVRKGAAFTPPDRRVQVRPAFPSQLAGAPFSTVTARRFCDQQEISSQTATGRSLP